MGISGRRPTYWSNRSDLPTFLNWVAQFRHCCGAIVGLSSTADETPREVISFASAGNISLRRRCDLRLIRLLFPASTATITTVWGMLPNTHAIYILFCNFQLIKVKLYIDTDHQFLIPSDRYHFPRQTKTTTPKLSIGSLKIQSKHF